MSLDHDGADGALEDRLQGADDALLAVRSHLGRAGDIVGGRMLELERKDWIFIGFLIVMWAIWFFGLGYL